MIISFNHFLLLFSRYIEKYKNFTPTEIEEEIKKTAYFGNFPKLYNSIFKCENIYDKKNIKNIYDRAVEFVSGEDCYLESAADELAILMAIQRTFSKYDEV